MRICKISEILTRVGEQISGVSGTLKSVYKPKTGEGKYGKWSLQDAILVDDSGEMTITFANFDDMSRLKGEKVTLTAKQGDKGLSGILCKDASYTNKEGVSVEKIVMHVTGSAMIDSGVTHEYDGGVNDIGTPVPQDADPEEKAALELLARKKAEKELAAKLEAQAKQKAKEQSESQIPPVNGMSYAAVKRRIVQTANLYSYALRSAAWALEKQNLNIKDLTTSAATLFIAFREDKLVDAMPMELMEDTENNDNQLRNFSSNYPKVDPIDPVAQPDPEPSIDQEPKQWFDVVVATKYYPEGIALGEMKDVEIMAYYNSFRPKPDPKTGNYTMKDIHIKNALKEWKNEMEKAI